MNTRRIVRRPAADDDVLESALHIAHNSRDAAMRFMDAVRQTEERLLATPGMGGKPSSSIRHWPACAFISCEDFGSI